LLFQKKAAWPSRDQPFAFAKKRGDRREKKDEATPPREGGLTLTAVLEGNSSEGRGGIPAPYRKKKRRKKPGKLEKTVSFSFPGREGRRKKRGNPNSQSGERE